MSDRDSSTDQPVILDCDGCVMQRTSECDDCVVTYLLDRPEGGVVFDVEEERAVRSMSAAGLIPTIRFRRRAG